MNSIYTEPVAAAARSYVEAARRDRAEKREGTKLQAAAALVRLTWMVTAEQYGWAPESYTLDP